MNFDNNFGKESKETLYTVEDNMSTAKGFKECIDSELLQRGSDMKKKIAVIFGGCSPEYSVSLQSAYAVISHMDKDKYMPVLIGITQMETGCVLMEILKKF